MYFSNFHDCKSFFLLLFIFSSSCIYSEKFYDIRNFHHEIQHDDTRGCHDVFTKTTGASGVPVPPTQRSTQCEGVLVKENKSNICCGWMQVWLASAGGSGTNILWNWIRDNRLYVGMHDSAWSDLVHSLSPTVDDYRYYMVATTADWLEVGSVRRAIFIYDDPCTQVNSLYRRGFHILNGVYKRLRIYNDTRNGFHLEFPQTYEGYASRGEDVYKLEEQWHSWTSAKLASSFPILSLKYEALWNYSDSIARFLDLNNTYINLPPRRSRHVESNSTMSNSIKRCQASGIHKSLEDSISSAPDFSIGWRGRHFKSIDDFLSFT